MKLITIGIVLMGLTACQNPWATKAEVCGYETKTVSANKKSGC